MISATTTKIINSHHRGNVAECCIANNGNGKILGLSAMSVSDEKITYQPKLNYVGFRIIVENKSLKK